MVCLYTGSSFPIRYVNYKMKFKLLNNTLGGVRRINFFLGLKTLPRVIWVRSCDSLGWRSLRSVGTARLVVSSLGQSTIGIRTSEVAAVQTQTVCRRT